MPNEIKRLAPIPASKEITPVLVEVEQPDLRCVNAHDRCYGGAGGPCPYCEPRTTPVGAARRRKPPRLAKRDWQAPIDWNRGDSK